MKEQSVINKVYVKILQKGQVQAQVQEVHVIIYNLQRCAIKNEPTETYSIVGKGHKIKAK